MEKLEKETKSIFDFVGLPIRPQGGEDQTHPGALEDLKLRTFSSFSTIPPIGPAHVLMAF